MTLAPLLQATPAIQVHVAAALVALILGALVLFGRKGNRWHRLGGRIWVAAMLVVCMSSFLIHEIRLVGPWSPIHILSIATVLFLARGVWLARKGRIREHRRTMQGTYFGSLIVAGSFTFLPGRIMHEVILADGSVSAPLLFALCGLAASVWLIRRLAPTLKTMSR